MLKSPQPMRGMFGSHTFTCALLTRGGVCDTWRFVVWISSRLTPTAWSLASTRSVAARFASTVCWTVSPCVTTLA